MGSMITLGIEKMEIDWGKNNTFTNHSALFQIDDIKQIPYYYADWDSEKTIVEWKEGYSKKLSEVKQRLDLLGYSIKNISKIFEEHIEETNRHEIGVNITFNHYYQAIYSIELKKVDMRFSSDGFVDMEEEGNGYDLGEYTRKCVLNDPEVSKLLIQEGIDKWDASYFFENIHPYITLRILAENPANMDLELQWRFADVVDNGWVAKEEIVCSLSQENKILIVTEGSSDSFVIRKAIDSLYHNIGDFFDFIDMQNNYPFTGVGNLYNFCMGLAKINIQNNIIVIFDNDIAGIEKYKRSLLLDKPKNLHICKLPNHESLNNFMTKGPYGDFTTNINGKAVSIECFLDFNSIDTDLIYIRWTSFNKSMEEYQGEIFPKEDLVRVFKRINLIDDTYDTSKLQYLIDYLITKWIVNQ